jgi:Fe-S cluster assembly protein SufD
MITLPTNRDENWRYANLRPLAKARADAPPPADAAGLPRIASLPGYHAWLYVDGRHVSHAEASDQTFATRLDTSAAGTAFASLLDASIAAAGVDFALARVNAARGNEVLHIAVPDGARTSIQVVFLARAGATEGTSYPRLQVSVGRNARLDLVEKHLSVATQDSVVNAAVDVSVGAGAELTHVRLQDCALQASCFDTLVAHVASGGRYALRTIALGALVSRSTAFIKLAGNDARCDFVAASVANSTQNHDFFVEIEHAAPRSATRELFRGIATERGKLGFNGKMIVRDGAHDADSDQSLKTLLTGSGAEAALRPQLEIYTDKVRAKHGATTGKLDEQMLFYMLSRGLDRLQAQALLQWAFVEEAVSQVEPAPLRQEIEQLIAAQLNEVSALDGLVARP